MYRNHNNLAEKESRLLLSFFYLRRRSDVFFRKFKTGSTMSQTSLFQEYWSKFQNRSLEDREKYFISLSRKEQQDLIRSFYQEGWYQLFVCNIVDDNLDWIKTTYELDLLQIRIQALHGRVFLIEQKIWDHIEELMYVYEDYYDMEIIFGGLRVSSWGKKRQFYRIRAINRSK